MKRSNAPVFWALFGAGGMLAALIAPMLVFITGVAVPTGRLLPADAMSYERMLTLARNGFGKLALLLVVLLFMFHGGLRMYHSLHHLGFHTFDYFSRDAFENFWRCCAGDNRCRRRVARRRLAGG